MVAQTQLFEKARLGDLQALSDLLNRCQVDARKYAAKHCRAADVEDAMQESLWAVSRGISSVRSAEAFSSWLFTIVKRECHRALRIAYKVFHPQEPEGEALGSVQDLDLRHDLVRCLQSLPPHYLQVILLRDFEELSVKEIAEELGEDVPAIKSRIHRAREMIREYLLNSKLSPFGRSSNLNVDRDGA